MGTFLRAVLTDNIFWTKLTASFENKDINDVSSIIEVEAKIDTGCYDTHISFDSMYLVANNDELFREKEKWLNLNRRYNIGNWC